MLIEHDLITSSAIERFENELYTRLGKEFDYYTYWKVEEQIQNVLVNMKLDNSEFWHCKRLIDKFKRGLKYACCSS